MGDEPRDDIVQQGGRQFRLPGWLPSRPSGWRSSRGAGILAVATLVVGLAAGYAAGDQHARETAVPMKQTATVSASGEPASGSTFSFADSAALMQGTGACSVQAGRRLALGVQVTNQSTTPITLHAVKALLPLGGLKQVTWAWATCGALPNGLGQSYQVLAPGASTWLTVGFDVLLRCPAPAPVQFSVDYLMQGHSVTASLPGFSDLGQVPYTGCASSV